MFTSARRFVLITSALALVALLAGASCGGGACATRAECGSGEACLFKVGKCNARGECVSLPNFGCDSFITYCGCHGDIVKSTCGYPDGYATGPSLGASCAEPDPGSTTEPGFSNDAAILDASGDAPVSDASEEAEGGG